MDVIPRDMAVEAADRPLTDVVGVEATYYLAQYRWLMLRRLVNGIGEVTKEEFTKVSNKIGQLYRNERNWRRAAQIAKVRDGVPAETELLFTTALFEDHDGIVEQAYHEVVRLSDMLFYSKSRENKLRRMAKRRGLRIEKSRRRNINALDYGMFALYNERKKEYVHPTSTNKYVYSLDHIEIYLKGTDIMPAGTPALMELVTPDAWDVIDLLNDWIYGGNWTQGKDDMLKASMTNVLDVLEQDPWGVSNEAV